MQADVLNISPIVVWVIALSQLLTFGLTIWNLMASGSRANAKRLDEQGSEITRHDSRLKVVELTVAEIPRRKDFHDLELQMTKLQGTMAVIAERMKPLESITERMQELLLERGK